MTKLAALVAALLVVASTGAHAGHRQVGDAARLNPDGNSSGNAVNGWTALSRNDTAREAADKTD